MHRRAFLGGAGSVYPDSHEHHFLAAFDLGGDRVDEMEGKARTMRRFLRDLPEETARTVACRSAWKLLLGEEIAL